MKVKLGGRARGLCEVFKNLFYDIICVFFCHYNVLVIENEYKGYWFKEEN